MKRYEKYEIDAHRWIQIPICRYNEMVQDGQLCGTRGYKYEDDNGNTYIELHANEHLLFQDKCYHLPYGGYLSVRKKKEKKPVMILGQDECILKQYTLTKKS
jgi:hypothetical protein